MLSCEQQLDISAALPSLHLASFFLYDSVSWFQNRTGISQNTHVAFFFPAHDTHVISLKQIAQDFKVHDKNVAKNVD